VKTFARRLAAIPDARWNFLMMGMDIAFFNLGLSISSPYTILPLFAAHLTNENWIIALIPAIRTLGVFGPPLLVAGFVERQTRVKPIMLRFTLLERIPFLLLAIGAVWLAHFNGLLLGIFFLLVFTQAAGGGLTFPEWLDFIARAIPARVRGRFLGGWSSAGYVAGAAGAALATAIVVALPWPWNFALCFMLSFVAVAISFTLLAVTREPLRVAVTAPPPIGSAFARSRAWLGDLWQVVHSDKLVQPFLAANAISGVALLSSGLLAVAALHQAHMGDAAVGLEATVLIAATTAGGFLWGWLGDHWGHRIVLVFGSLCGAAAMAVEVVAYSPWLVTSAFILFGLSTSALSLAQLSFVVEFGTPARRPTYIGLTFLLYTPCAVLAPILGGIIADQWGYTPVFLMATLAGIAATVAFAMWVRDPRPRGSTHGAVAVASEE
jgi:MFS family permease